MKYINQKNVNVIKNSDILFCCKNEMSIYCDGYKKYKCADKSISVYHSKNDMSAINDREKL